MCISIARTVCMIFLRVWLPAPGLTVPFSSGNNSAGACALSRNDNRKPQFAASVPGRCIRSGSGNCKAGSWTAGQALGWLRPECSASHCISQGQSAVPDTVSFPIGDRDYNNAVSLSSRKVSSLFLGIVFYGT